MSVFLIAEIGINHNGDLNIAKKLIDSAAEAGFDAVKFQKRSIDKVYSQDFLNSHRESLILKKSLMNLFFHLINFSINY